MGTPGRRVAVVQSYMAHHQGMTIVAIANAFTGRMGTSALAGYGIGTRLEFLMVSVIFGIGAALITMVGANVGAGRRDRAIRIAWTGAFAAGAITGAIGLAAALVPGWWVGSFTTDPAVAEACRRHLQTVGPFYALFGHGLALYFASHGLRSIAGRCSAANCGSRLSRPGAVGWPGPGR